MSDGGWDGTRRDETLVAVVDDVLDIMGESCMHAVGIEVGLSLGMHR